MSILDLFEGKGKSSANSFSVPRNTIEKAKRLLERSIVAVVQTPLLECST